jgi:hypothetical protein
MSQPTASPEQIQKLYDPNTFFEYGDNPALKKFMEMMVENCREGKMIDYRTPVLEKYRKIWLARNWDDVLQRDLKCYTFPRSLAVFGLSSMVFLITLRWTRLLMPIGENGITKISQTQFYHLYGPFGAACAFAIPLSAFYLWYKTGKFTAKKFYNHVILGDRQWLFEDSRQNPSYGEYYFKDTYLSHEEALPDVARGEMAKNKWPKPDFFAK